MLGPLGGILFTYTVLIWGYYETAPTEGRFARPEQRWGCRCGTPLCDAMKCLMCAGMLTVSPQAGFTLIRV